MVNSYDRRVLHAGYTLEPSKILKFGKPRKLVTFVASRKNGNSIGCESLLEADFCIYLEYQPAITAYQSQPFTICFSTTRRRYTPDFMATLADGSQVIYEVKSDAGARNRRWSIKRAVLEQFFSLNNLKFECVEEHQFCRPIEIQNLRTLYHLGYHGSLSRVPYILRLLSKEALKSTTIAILLKHGVSQADITCALFHQHLHCNLQRPINLMSRVW